jgi:hypothetical protein
MFKFDYLKIFFSKNAGILALFAIVTMLGFGTGKVLPQDFWLWQSAEQKAESDLAKGDYAAALVAFNNLKEDSPNDEGVVAKYREAKSMVIAEELFNRAKKAAEDGAWLDTKVLLDDENIVLNPGFKHYDEAVTLYKDAEERITVLEQANDQTILKLEQLSEEERARAEQIAADLQNISLAKQKTEQDLESAQGELSDVQSKATQTLADLESEQLRAQDLADQIEEEQLAAFAQELKIYADMLTQGEWHLNNGLVEISQSEEINTLILVGQAKSFFEEVKSKANDLRDNRPLGQYMDKVDLIIQSANLYLSAGKSLRNAVVYIDDQQSAGYIEEINQVNSLKAQARALLNLAYQFIEEN